MEHREIERINELARKKKTVGLTEAELAEQAELRKRYIAEFRASMQDVLDHTVVQEPDGTKIPLKDYEKAMEKKNEGKDETNGK